MYSTVNNNRDLKRLDKDGNPVIGVVEINNFTPPPLSDTVTVNYPNTTTEVYEYRQGGISGSILSTVTVTYTTASKQFLVSVVVT